VTDVPVPGELLASNTLWYVSRASGTVSLLLLTASVLMGILTWSRWQAVGWPRFLTAGLHRNISLLAITFVCLHAIANVADSYVSIDVADAIVPFDSAYRPLWLGLGAVAFDLLIALTITSLLQRRLGWRRWRAAHWLAYACWPVALVHSLGTGTDPRTSWFSAVALVCGGAVTAVVLVRIAQARSGAVRLRIALGAAGVGLTALIATWPALGPLHAG
jgi:methionine sulfoxide reductase heme-binding subunit